jgi:hypothetical protein
VFVIALVVEKMMVRAKTSAWRVVVLSAGVGLCVPLGCEVARRWPGWGFGEWTTWVWPSSVFLMAIGDGGGGGAYEAWILALSVTVNVLVYVSVGVLLSFACRRLRRE